MDEWLGLDPTAVVGRFLWWVENADLDGWSEAALTHLSAATDALQMVEAELEGEPEEI